MKLLLITIVSAFIISAPIYDDMLAHTGLSINKNDSKEVALESVKNGYNFFEGMKSVTTIKVKGTQSSVKLKKGDVKEFILCAGENMTGEIVLYKFTIVKDDRIAENVYSVIKPSLNKEFESMPITTSIVNSKNQVVKCTLSSDLPVGSYGFFVKQNRYYSNAIVFDIVE